MQAGHLNTCGSRHVAPPIRGLTTAHDADVQRAAIAAVCVAGGLAFIKAVCWVLTGAVSMLASLIDSLLDIGASLVNLVAVRYASQPEDAEHRFGHGNAEPIAGLLQSLIIAMSGLFLLYHAVPRLIEPVAVARSGLGIVVIVVSIVATALLVVFQRRVVRRSGSVAISADSLHYSMDLVTNAAVIVALVGSDFGWLRADPIIALLLGGVVLYGAGRVAYESAQLLLDRELPDEVRDQIHAICRNHTEVAGVHALRTRRVGRVPHILVDLVMDGSMSLRRAHDVGLEVTREIKNLLPDADVTVHHDPVDDR